MSGSTRRLCSSTRSKRYDRESSIRWEKKIFLERTEAEEEDESGQFQEFA